MVLGGLVKGLVKMDMWPLSVSQCPSFHYLQKNIPCMRIPTLCEVMENWNSIYGDELGRRKGFQHRKGNRQSDYDEGCFPCCGVRVAIEGSMHAIEKEQLSGLDLDAFKSSI